MLKIDGFNMLIQLRLYRRIIHDYKYNDILYRSEQNGILFWLSDEEKELVATFEKENEKCKVYHVIKTETVDFGTVYDLLYVVDEEGFMNKAKEDLKDGLVLSYTISSFSESGLIAVESLNGGVIRKC